MRSNAFQVEMGFILLNKTSDGKKKIYLSLYLYARNYYTQVLFKLNLFFIIINNSTR